MKKIWKEKFKVNWEETTLNGNLSLSALNLFLIRAAARHSEHLNFGYSTLSKENISWVLYRLNIKINRLPLLNENISIITWPRSVSGISASRDFEMTSDDSQEILCKATSDWLLINLDSRKPQRMKKFTDSKYLNINKKAIDEIPVEINKKCDFKNLFSVKTRYSDLDMNGHVIAHKYFSWLQDAIYLLHGDKQPSFIQMNYFNECDINEEISIKYCPDNILNFMGLKLNNGKSAFTSIITF